MKTKRSKEMQEWFEFAEQSGWTLADVAEAAGIATSTAVWWKRRLRDDGSLSCASARGFVELVAEPEPEAESAALRTEAAIVLPSGLRIELGANAFVIAEIVRRIEQC